MNSPKALLAEARELIVEIQGESCCIGVCAIYDGALRETAEKALAKIDQIAALSMDWVGVEGFKAVKGQRALTYSPDYPEGDPMRYRVVDAEFVRTMTEVTHVMLPTPPQEAKK